MSERPHGEHPTLGKCDCDVCQKWDRDNREDQLETQLACACDLVNSWCREISVRECPSPYSGLHLREAIDRLWSKVSGERESLRSQLHAARELERKRWENAARTFGVHRETQAPKGSDAT